MTGDQTDLSGDAITTDDKPTDPTDDDPPRKHCDVCGELVTVDDQEAVERWGQVVCSNCRDVPVAFRVFCTRCTWTEVHEATEYDRGQAKQNAQREGNNHETEKELFEDEPDHEKRVTEIVPGTFDYEPGKYDGYTMPRGPLGQMPKPEASRIPPVAIGFCPLCGINCRETTGARGVFHCPQCLYQWYDERVGEQPRSLEDFVEEA